MHGQMYEIQLNLNIMRRFLSIALLALCAAFTVTSCETRDPDKDFSGTIYGFWVVDKLVVDASLTINGTTTSNTTTTDFTKEYCRLNLDTSHIATLWFNLKFESELFSYDESKQRIEFKEALDLDGNGKAITILGIYDVKLEGDNLVLKQPEASIGIGGYGASEQATYYFHRAPKSEKPKETNQ